MCTNQWLDESSGFYHRLSFDDIPFPSQIDPKNISYSLSKFEILAFRTSKTYSRALLSHDFILVGYESEPSVLELVLILLLERQTRGTVYKITQSDITSLQILFLQLICEGRLTRGPITSWL